ncbi:Aste57867_2669 [Aphanomyces stellatus]|uniref:Aste57867_2669 protein n=1 Tax=Aphanomyces stellatus TaxID=120398 RepID=A0A485K8T2_9STRA|nr:hypothetical protein As57867_002662 [Aphanomyces stellatus]VFT79863.1 Aste57867_2669 [Aphanomyces stellatus]
MQPYKGTILLNPGGPGGLGVGMARPSYVTLTGGHYDVLGFDPRGVGQSRPLKCSKNSYTSARELGQIYAKDTPFDTDSSDTSVGRFGADMQVQVRRCEKYDGEFLQYLSTAYVARDMDLIRAALGESVLSFYGISYGSYVAQFIGLTYANMFPDRVGQIAIDSVLDPIFYTGPTPELLLESVYDLDTIYHGFGAACEAEGPNHCALAENSTRSGYVLDKLQALFDRTDESPLIVPTQDGDFAVLSGSQIRASIVGTFDGPARWSKRAQVLQQIIDGTYVAKSIEESCPATDTYRGAGMESSVYIANDGNNSGQGNISWEDLFIESKAINSLFGPYMVRDSIYVKYWTTKPVERYAGPWNKPFKRPLLILNNEWDPSTPLRWAQHTAQLLGENGILVTREGFGHSVKNLPSVCIQQITIDFFTNGTNPEPNTICKVDVGPFGTPVVREAASAVEAARQDAAEYLSGN